MHFMLAFTLPHYKVISCEGQKCFESSAASFHILKKMILRFDYIQFLRLI